jgi:hypothetical protein
MGITAFSGFHMFEYVGTQLLEYYLKKEGVIYGKRLTIMVVFTT